MPTLTIQAALLKGSAPRAAIVVLTGGVAVDTLAQFQDTLSKMKKFGVLRFVLDLTNVTFMNSTALGCMVEIADTVTAQGGCVALVNVQPKVQVVLDMLGLNAFFQTFETRDAAYASLGVSASSPEGA